MADKLEEMDLKALLSEEIQSAIAYDDTELSRKRAQAMEYYRGEMSDTPAMPGRSSVVSRDVADTIGWMLPGIIRVFTASDQMALCEPVRPGDEEFADQATDYVNYIFMKDNPGYRILWDATHDSLLQGNGVVKHWWDDKEECDYYEQSGMTEEQIAILLSEQGVEVVAQKPGEPQKVMAPDEMGNLVEQEIQTFDLKLKRVTMAGRVRVDAIEPEDFLLDREARCIEDARFCAHRDYKTRSDLIEMGFPRDLVEGLGAEPLMYDTEEKIAREDEFRSYNDVASESMQLIELFECYLKVDADGDGIAETVRAYYAGDKGAGELLDWEVWEDDVPFSDIPCEPVPHRWEARSVTDETLDIQRIKTVLTRQFLDNLYWVNNPMMTAEEGKVANPEMLKAPKFGGTVFTKPGATPPTPLPVPFIGDKALLGLQHFDQVREMRTGVSRSTMALDPEALQNQTATANQNQKDAAYSQVELIARNQAELGWKRVFKQILKLIVKHQDRPRTIRLRDEWVEMDPRAWNAGMDVTINVGLGTGSRDRDMAMLNNVVQSQFALTDRMAAAGFMDQAIAMIPKIIHTLQKIGESAGLKNADSFYPDISEEDVPMLVQRAQEMANKPDPEVQKAQMKIAADAEKAKADAQLDLQKMQIEAQFRAQEMQMEHQRKIEQINAELVLKREQLAAELQLKRELAYAEMEVKREIGIAGAAAKAQATGGGTSDVHPGGEPG